MATNISAVLFNVNFWVLNDLIASIKYTEVQKLVLAIAWNSHATIAKYPKLSKLLEKMTRIRDISALSRNLPQILFMA